MANLVLTMAAGMTAVAFGANTLGGEGALPAPSGATLLMTGTAGGYTQTGGAGGDVAPTSDGSADPGTLIFDDGTTWTATVPANTYHFTDTAELQNAIADNGTTGGTQFVMRDGSDALTTQTTISTDFVSEVTIKAENYRAATLGRILYTGSNVKFDRLNFTMPLNASHAFLIEVQGTPGALTFDYCYFECTEDITSYDFQTLESAAWPIAIGGNSITMDNFTARGCWFSKFRRAFLIQGDTMDILGNRIEDCTESFINITTGDNIRFNDNVCQGIWSNFGTDAGTPAPKQAFGPGWGSSGNVTSMEIIGNRMFLTDRRFQALGDVRPSSRGLAFDLSTGAHTGVKVHHNISVHGNSSGDMKGIQSGDVYNNTWLNDPVAASGSKVSTFSVQGIGTDCLLSKNIGLPAASTATARPAGFYHQAWDNAASDESAGLQGDHDVEITFDNYETELTPKAGTYWTDKGAIQSDFTFATGIGTENYVPHVDNSSVPTIPETTTTTGQVIAGYTFDGTSDGLDGVTMTLSGNQVTFMIGFELTDDTDDCRVLNARGTNTDVHLRRVGSSGGMIFNIGSTFPSYYIASDGWLAADGVQNVILIIDGDTGEAAAYVNGYRADITELAGATRWPETFTLDFSTDISLMQDIFGSNRATGDLSYFWMSDVFLNLESQTILNALCAQDGGAPNFDADGGIASAGIAQPQIYIHAGNANGIEDNLGTKGAAGDFTVSGSPTAPP